MDMPQDRPIWERLDGETPRAYDRFCIYRDMGVQRSIDGVGRQLGHKSATGQISLWSREYAWYKRAQAYDAYLEHQARIAHEQEIMEARRQWARDAEVIRQKSMDRVQDPFSPTFTAIEAVTAWEKASKQWREAMGVPSVDKVDKKVVEISGPNGSTIALDVNHGLDPDIRQRLLGDGEISRAFNLLLSKLSTRTGADESSGSDDAGQPRPDPTGPPTGDDGCTDGRGGGP